MLRNPPEPIPRWTSRQTRRNLVVLALAAVLVALLLAAAIVNDRARAANRERTRDVALFAVYLRDIYGLHRDMQTGMRGYLVTGDETFLQPYTRAQTRLPGLWPELQALAPAVGPRAAGLLREFSSAGEVWHTQAIQPELARPPGEEQPAGAEAAARRDRRLFDDFQTRYDALASYTREREIELEAASRRLGVLGEVLLGLLALTTFGALLYGIWLVRRIGLFANRLQVRQDRQQGYTRVISALNGPAELTLLVDEALPVVLASVGAQAGVVYTCAGAELAVVGAVGLDASQLSRLRLDEGLPGAAMQQRRLLLVTDLPADTPYRIQIGIGSAPPRSVVNVPLYFGDDILGVLTVASVHIFDDEELQLLGLIASQFATALSNVRAFEETQRQREELRASNAHLARLLEQSDTLQEIGRELAAQRDLQTLLQLVCRGARRLLRADYTAVATATDTQGSTRWVAVDGVRSELYRGATFLPHQGMAGRTIDRQAPVVVENFGENRDFPVEEFVISAAEGMRSGLAVPLFRREQAVGALIVGFRQPHTVGDEDIQLATAIAAYASVAIENARLMSELSTERDRVAQRAVELHEKNVEIERANHLKSEFVANMSHELRTPLTSILALSQMLLDGLDGALNEEQNKQVSIIERNGENLLRLINDILDLSKIEAGKLELAPGQFSVEDLLESARLTVAPLVAEKGLALELDIHPNLPPMFTDENKLKQILLNLLSNAVKFTQAGRVSLRAWPGPSARAADGAAPVPAVTFQVADTGIGIAAADQETIWQEFTQIDGSLARRYEGTGLGLAIVRRLVGLLGGTISLESEPGKGSTFTFTIPSLASAPESERLQEVMA